jgi:hypothetical protein
VGDTNSFEFVNLFPIKVYQNYFREQIDAAQCHLAEKSCSSLVKSFGNGFRYYVIQIVGQYHTTDFLFIFSHILTIPWSCLTSGFLV